MIINEITNDNIPFNKNGNDEFLTLSRLPFA